MKLRIADLCNALEVIAPLRHAEPWDNVGLLLGDRGRPLESVLLCIDLSNEVVAEASAAGCQAVVAYHPPIFEGLKRLGAGNPVFAAAEARLAVYSPHTALDAAPGGTNDTLAELLELGPCEPLQMRQPAEAHHKLVVFVPAEALDKVSAALFAAGAGHIGNYHSCSFRTPGTGTFHGGEGARPVVGEAGRLEEVQEVRLETLVPLDETAAVLRALRQSHPYEEPAFDLLRLAAAPEQSGMGRIGAPAKPTSRAELWQRLRRALDAPLLVAGPDKGAAKRVALCAGAGGELLGAAMKQDADVYVTGELRHHDALKAARRGVMVICTRHSTSERPVLQRVAERLRAALPALRIDVSKSDVDPFTFV